MTITNTSKETAGTGFQQKLMNVTDDVSWNGQAANSPQFAQQIFVLSYSAAQLPTAASESPISVNTQTGEITLAPSAAPGTYAVKTLLCLTVKSQSRLERFLDFLSIRAAFADGVTAVNLVGSAPCVNETTYVMVESTLIAQDDAFNTWINQAVSGSVATNDTYPSGAAFNLLNDVAHGRLTFFDDGGFSYKPKRRYKGADAFSYALCEPAPKASICTSGNVTLNAGTVKLPQRPIVLNTSNTTTAKNVPILLKAKGGSVHEIPGFTAISSTGANCKITGSGSTRALWMTGESGATCTLTATKKGNKKFEPVTSDKVTVTLQ